MPPIDDQDVEDIEPDSSAGADQDVAAAALEAAQNAEPSSRSPDVPEERDTASIVRDVVDKRVKPEAAASSADGEAEPDLGDDTAQKDTPEDDEFKDVPFGKHPRFQQLLRERNEFKGDAEQYRNVQAFMENAGLEPKEAADALVIAGLIKTNPPAAWERLKPLVKQVLIAAGEVLPDDLKAMVEAGDMTLEAAKTVSRSRAEVLAVKTGQTFQEQQAERQQQNEQATALQSAAAAWEADRIKKDPNFAAKAAALGKEILWLQRTDGKPTTPEGVKAQLNKAYKAIVVAAPANPVNPSAAKPALKPVTSTASAARAEPDPKAAGKPKTTQDIVDRVLAKRTA